MSDSVRATSPCLPDAPRRQAGVLIVRQNGILPTLHDASAAELLQLLGPMADALQQPS